MRSEQKNTSIYDLTENALNEKLAYETRKQEKLSDTLANLQQ